VGFKRGKDSIEVELANVQSCLEVLDPLIRDRGGLEERVDELESDRDTWKGSLRIIIWLNGVIIGILLLLGGWCLQHLTIRASFDKSDQSQNLPQDSQISPHWGDDAWDLSHPIRRIRIHLDPAILHNRQTNPDRLARNRMIYDVRRKWGKMIEALNRLNTPWVAIVVIVLGMVFDIFCKVYSIPNDAATGVIGAGIGLLTGQALHNGASQNPPPNNPTK
jgi:hypothetical protein